MFEFLTAVWNIQSGFICALSAKAHLHSVLPPPHLIALTCFCFSNRHKEIVEWCYGGVFVHVADYFNALNPFKNILFL